MDPKTSKQKVSDERKDRLSNLPDTVLTNILGYLPTVDLVRSTVLSKRWEHICSSLEAIHLVYSVPETIHNEVQREDMEKSFLQFVDELVRGPREAKIRKMFLEFDAPVENLVLREWIEVAVRNKVQYLHLNLNLEEEYNSLMGVEPDNEGEEVVEAACLPPSLYGCDSLIVLELNLRCLLSSQSTSLPQLEELCLNEVVFKDDQTFKSLFSNCPLLSKLDLVQCNWKRINNVDVSVPELESLTVEGDADTDFDDSVIQIYAPNLACLDFRSNLHVDFDFGNLSSLKTAFLDLPYDYVIDDPDPDDAQLILRALKLFSAIDKVERLDITANTIEYLKAFLDQVETLCNLTHLTVVTSKVGLFKDFKASNSIFLLSFLGKMPQLVYINLGQVSRKDEHTSLQNDLTEERVPSCFKSSLRTFALEKFSATEHEMLLLKYVIKYAVCLESLSISCSRIHLQEERLSMAKDQLQSASRGSQNCKFDFSYE